MPLRRLRFAGAPVSPRGCLLIAGDQEAAAWSALSAALVGQSPRWSVLQCLGRRPWPAACPAPILAPTPEYSLTLPPDFAAYMGGLTSAARKSLRQKLRRVARAGEISEVPFDEHPAALQRFLELHHLRTDQRGERHPQMDGRLLRLLAALSDHGDDVRLRVFVLRVRGQVVASTVRLDHGRTAYFYNGGFDPGHARLSPGICVELASIRDAIDRGMRRFDLGPGSYRYKTDLGGVPTDRFNVTVAGRHVPHGVLSTAHRLRALAKDGADDMRH